MKVVEEEHAMSCTITALAVHKINKKTIDVLYLVELTLFKIKINFIVCNNIIITLQFLELQQSN